MKRINQSHRKQLDQFFEPSQKLSAVDVEPALQRLLDRQPATGKAFSKDWKFLPIPFG